jgi:O-antigen ligase
LALGSRTPAEWLDVITGAHAGNTAEGNPLDHVFFLSLAVGACLIASSRGFKWKRLFVSNVAITLFYLYFATSVLWAENPAGSFRRWFKDFGYLFVIALILSEKDPWEAMRAVYVRSACVLLPLSVVCNRYYPDISRRFDVNGDMMLSGIAMLKNTLGESLMVLGLFLAWDFTEARFASAKRVRRWDHVVLGMMTVSLLIVSDSKTALACLVIALVLMVRQGRLAYSKLINRMLLLAGLSLPFLLLLTEQFRATMAPVFALLGRDVTLTGRTAIWEHITLTTVNPLFGAGFFNFWGQSRGKAIMAAMKTGIPSAHNGYLDIYLDGGFIGLGLLFCVLFGGVSRVIKNFRVGRFQQFRFAFLIAAIFYNLSESAFARPSVLWFTTLLFLIDYPSRKAQSESPDVGGRVEIADLPQEASPWV